jgi:hypothetical protein
MERKINVKEAYCSMECDPVYFGRSSLKVSEDLTAYIFRVEE